MLITPTMQVSAEEVAAGTANLNYTYDNIDGGSISTQSNGKPKILVFFKVGCGNCKNTLRDISSSEWIKNGDVDVCAIEFAGASVDEIISFRDTYCPEGYIAFGTSDSAFTDTFRYMSHLSLGNSIQTPLMIMVNSNNEIRGYTFSLVYATEIEETYLPLIKEDTQEPGDAENPDDSQEPGDSENPDDSQNPGGAENPDDSQQPDDSQKPEDNKKPDKSKDSDDSDEADQAAREAEALENMRKNDPGVKYANQLKDMAASLRSTKQNEFVMITGTWTCFNRTLLEAIESRPDVTVIVNYIYGGKSCVLTIPAGTNVTQYMDANGFAGFLYIEKMLNTKN